MLQCGCGSTSCQIVANMAHAMFMNKEVVQNVNIQLTPTRTKGKEYTFTPS